LRARGTEFLDIPAAYYTELKRRLSTSKVQARIFVSPVADTGTISPTFPTNQFV
jgi:hypothetical protein